MDNCYHCGNPATLTAQAFLNDMPESGKVNLCEECAQDYRADSAHWVVSEGNK